jgi:hypothetical protein
MGLAWRPFAVRGSQVIGAALIIAGRGAFESEELFWRMGLPPSLTPPSSSSLTAAAALPAVDMSMAMS